jgi:hypothetical protein
MNASNQLEDAPMSHDIQIRVAPHGIHSEIHITVSFPDEWGDALVGALKAAACRDDPEVLSLVKRLITMSQTNQQIVDAANAATSASLADISTTVGTIATELQAVIPAPGAVPSPESLATMTANVAKLQGLQASLDALAAPPPPPPLFNGSDTPPNAPGGRNTSHLPGFDPTQPETP